MLKTYNSSKSNTASMSAPETFAVNVTATDITCYGFSDGKAYAVTTGGITPYTYQWDDPSSQTTTMASGLGAGTYGVTVTDGAGGTVTGSANISEPALLSITGIVDSASSGNNNGAITVTVTGGTPPYTYLWNNGTTTKDLTGLPPGFYFLTVKDKNGCNNMNSFYVPQAIGIEEKNVENPDLLVFPNPTTGKFTILIALTPGREVSLIEIINVLGQKVDHYKVPKGSGYRVKYEADLTGQPEGLYLVQIHSDMGIRGKNIIIE